VLVNTANSWQHELLGGRGASIISTVLVSRVLSLPGIFKLLVPASDMYLETRRATGAGRRQEGTRGGGGSWRPFTFLAGYSSS